MKPVRSRIGPARQRLRHQAIAGGPARKLPIWERSKKEKNKNRFVRVIFLFIALIILVNVVIRAPAIYRGVSHPFERFPGEHDKLASLDTSFRTNLLLVSYKSGDSLVDAAVVSYEPTERRLTVLFFNLSENSKFKKTADDIFEKGGIVGLERLISNEIAVPLDRYLAFEDSDLTFTPENASSSFKEIKSARFFFKALPFKQVLNKVLKTNLTSSEIFDFIWKVRSAEFEQKDNISLNETDSGILGGQETKGLIGSLFIDHKISDEGAAVTIRNSSGKAGLGTVLSDYLVNLGATVVTVETGEEPTRKSFLVAKNSKPQLEKRLSSIISFDKKKPGVEDFSGDILIVVGEDAAKMLTLP